MWKAWSQCSHLNGRIPSCSNMCLLRAVSFRNLFPHLSIGQGNLKARYSAVWGFFWCFIKSLITLKPRPQSSHLILRETLDNNNNNNKPFIWSQTHKGTQQNIIISDDSYGRESSVCNTEYPETNVYCKLNSIMNTTSYVSIFNRIPLKTIKYDKA